MKKILTVLLSFLMVATLGIVNVSAESKSSGEAGSYTFNMTMLANADSAYSGSKKDVFRFSGVSNLGNSEYVYYYASDTDMKGKSIAWNKYTGNTITVEKTNAGKYYFYAVVSSSSTLTSTALNNEGKPVSYGSEIKAYQNYEVEITKQLVGININQPMTSSDENGKAINYFVVGDSDVKIPFSAVSGTYSGDTFTELTTTTLKWEATITSDANSKITFESGTSSNGKIDGTLNVAKDLPAGIFDVKLQASIDSNNNYKDNGGSTIEFKIVKADTSENAIGYVFNYDDTKVKSSYDTTSGKKTDITYGSTASDIKGAVQSIKLCGKYLSGQHANEESCDFGYEVWSSTTGDDATYAKTTTASNAKVYKTGTTEASDGSILNVTGYNNKITEDITSKYYYKTTSGEWKEGEYSYTATDFFKIVEKDASADVTAKTGLVYDRDEKELVTATNILPKGNGSTKDATITYKVGTSFDTSKSDKEQWNAIPGDGSETAMATDAGTYYVYYYVNSQESENYKDYYGHKEVTIAQKSITDFTVTGPEDVTYDGKAHKLFPTVKDGDTEINVGNDVYVKYTRDGVKTNDFTSAGTIKGTVIAKNPGNYTGTASTTFEYTIKQKSIADLDITNPSDVTYNGSSQECLPTVKDGGTTLIKDKDYKLSYSEDTTNVGEVTVTIEGKGNYIGTATATYNITAKSISNVTVEGLENKNYNGQAQKLEPTVKDGDTTLEKDKDYTLSYNSSSDGEDCIKAGTVTVTITGIGNYKETATKTYIINAICFELAASTLDAVTYNGSAQTPEPVVKANDKVLTKGTDYTLSYSSNTNAGTATITVTGIGNYSGTATARFSINKATAYIKTGSTTASSSDYTYYKNDKGDVTLVSTGVFSEFDKLQISNGENFTDVGTENYTTASGSTCVTLKESYLQTLEYDKDYVFKFVYKTDNYTESYPTVTLKVRKYTAPSNNSSSSSSTTTTAKKVVNTAAQ